ncbi:MAG: hypothetical protein IPM48_14735 [Saprospiraceae bacterium]|nr:hypothetical protein [Saprospiraceae bacterium]
MAELTFHSRMVREKQYELNHWEQQVQAAQRRIEGRVGLEHDKYFINWSMAFRNGMIYKVKSPKTSVSVGKEEKRPNAK